MATRQKTRRVRVGSSDQAVGLGVYAPSSRAVQSESANKAFALANALQLGSNIYADQVARKQDADFAAGIEAAQAGEVDEESLAQLEASEAYVRGATLKVAEGRAIEDRAALVEAYQNEFDKTASLEELDEFLKEQYQARYEGLDPELYQAVLPQIERSVGQIMASHAEGLNRMAQQDVQSAIVTSAQQAFDDGVMDAEAWNATRQEAIALTGDKDLANELLFGAVQEHVARTGNAELWDEPYLEKLRTNPKYANAAARSQAEAFKARRDQFERENVMALEAIRADLYERAQARDPSVLADLREGLETGMVDQEVVRRTVSAYADAVAQGQKMEIQTDDFFAGNSSYHNLSDSDYDTMAQAAYQELVAEHGEEALPLMVDAVGKNGRMPKFLKRLIQDASPTHPAKFEQAYDLYARLRDSNPGGYKNMISEKAQARFDAYELLRESYPDDATQRLAEVDRSLISQIPREDYNDSLDDAVANMADGPWLNNLDEADPYVRKVVKERYDLLLSLGRPPEEAAEFAVNELRTRFQIIDGQLWPKADGFSGQYRPEDVLEYARESYELVDEAGRDYEVVPARGRPGHAWVRPKGAFAFGGVRVKIADLEAGYRAQQSADRNIAAQRKQAEVQNEILQDAKQRATGLYSLPFDESATGVKLREEQDAAWNALPAEVRLRHLEDSERLVQERLDEKERRGQQNLDRISGMNLNAL